MGCEQQRLHVKLLHQGCLQGPDDFSYTDLPGPVHRPRRAQVHEVDARDQQDEDRDSFEKPDVFNPSAGDRAVLKGRVKIFFCKGLQRQLEVIAFGVLPVVALDKMPDLRTHIVHIGMLTELDKYTGTGIVPVFQPRIFFQEKIPVEYKLELI